MITFKCKNCGGEVSINAAGDLLCPYCGTKANFSDAELRGYREFRSSMLQYLASVASNKDKETDAEYIWKLSESVSFETNDGTEITINYIYQCEDNSIKMYAARNSVIYVFPRAKAELAEMALRNVSSLTYPSADMKDLRRLVPELKGHYILSDGSVMLVYNKPENLFPLPLFGALEYVHVAWIVSRLENIACLLAFNNVVHGDITPDTLFINPKSHEVTLMGGWWNMEKGYSEKDLKDLRKTAKLLLSDYFKDIPKMFKDFLDGRPKNDAFKDFEYWDYVIENGLGGRHFHVLSADKILEQKRG